MLNLELVGLSDEVAKLSKPEGTRIKVWCQVEQLLANGAEVYLPFLGFFLGKNFFYQRHGGAHRLQGLCR